MKIGEGNTLVRWLIAFAFLSLSVEVANARQEVVIQSGNTITPAAVPVAQPPKAANAEEASDDKAAEEKAEAEAEADKPAETPKADEAKKDEKGAADSIKRPAEPPAPPDRKEFAIRPDEDGMVQFRFRNQPWPDLLRWLAEVSNMSLDWQELPSDFLNLSTQRKYTLEEARDLFNRHLLARGYTMLEFEGVLHVVKTGTINPALVPKVLPSQLDSLPPNRFVRVLFTLNHLIAEDVIDEFKVMLSTNGKMNSLTNTNRLDAMDAVVNLREIYHIVRDEQSETALEQLAKEFHLTNIRAADVKSQLEEFLGLSRRAAASTEGMSPEQAAMIQQQQMAMEQQQQAAEAAAAAAAGAVPGAKKRRNVEIYLIANHRQNSLIAHAPPDKMAIIEAYIRRVDIENESMNLDLMEARMRIFRLESLSPDKLVKSLRGMDALEPTTRLEIDDDNNAIIAYASLADQITIQKVIEKLDGSARQFDVIQLRRLKADQIAGTIKFMLGGGEKKEDNRSRRFYYYDWSQQDKKKSNDAFRVGANVQDNQLLIWANELERKEITKLLKKLNEIPSEEGQLSPFRTIDAARSPETMEYLRRLQKRWEQMSPNELILPPESEFQDEPIETEAQPELPMEDAGLDGMEDDPGVVPSAGENKDGPVTTEKQESSEKNETTDKVEAPQQDKTIGFQPARPILIADAIISKAPVETRSTETKSIEEKELADDVPLGHLSSYANQPPSPSLDETLPSSSPSQPKPTGERKKSPGNNVGGNRQAANGAPPIKISVDEKGNLVLYSEDQKALDQLDLLMRDMTPPKRPHVVFKVKHASPFSIRMRLQDYFKGDEKKSSDDDPWLRYIFDLPEEKKQEPQLGDQKAIRFISDNDTRSIMVIGADPPTLKTIRELISVWDVKTEDQDKIYKTRMIKIEYSKAESIVEAIKEAYREMLSATDKTFQEKGDSGGGDEKGRSSDSGMLGFSLKSELSLGVDKVTNTIIVTAKGDMLMKTISEMIIALDKAAMPNGDVQIVNLNGASNVKSLEKAIKAMLRASGQDTPAQAAEEAAAQAQREAQAQAQAPRANGRE